MRLLFREALPAGEVAADLMVHLDGEVGWAVAPRFNGAVHAVRRISRGTLHSREEETSPNRPGASAS